MGRQKYKFQPTATQIAKIREEWGARKVVSIARDLGITDDVLSLYARNELGLPRRSSRVMDDNHWTEEEDARLLAAPRGKGAWDALVAELPGRSKVAIRSRLQRLMQAEKKPDLKREIEERRQRFAAKPVTALEPLKYTLDDCPRVTLDDACRWMRQVLKGWQRPANDRDAWREINAQRLFGEYPVPPFLPIKPPVHNDNARIVMAPLPEWRVGA